MKYILFFALIFFTSDAGKAQTVSNNEVKFPNGSQLEWCVRKHFQNPYIQKIHEADTDRIVTLNCGDRNINSLEGIGQLRNLQVINMGLQGTGISDLSPLADMTKLIRIEIPRSKISDVSPLVNLKNLYYLNLSENSVTDLRPLATLTKLNTLVLYRQGPNYIRDITPLATLPNMYALNLESNKITDLTPLSNMKHLQFLHVMDNRLTSVKPLENTTSLLMLNISINAIPTLEPLRNLRNLNTLYAHNNRLTSLAFIDSSSNIKILDVTRNLISNISPLANLHQPAVLNLDQNMITDITPLKKIINDRFLLELGLGYNCISNEMLNTMQLYFVGVVRRSNQCEPLPSRSVYDYASIVNPDILLGYSGGGGGDIDEDLMAQASRPWGPGGCSIASGAPYDIFILVILLFGGWVLRRKMSETKK